MQDCKLEIINNIDDRHENSLVFLNVILREFSLEEKDNIILSLEPELLDKISDIVCYFYPEVSISRWTNFLMLTGDLVKLKSLINRPIHDFGNQFNDVLLASMFVAYGNTYYIADGNKKSTGYNLEFVFKSVDMADWADKLMAEHKFKRIERQNSIVLYTKNSETICAVLIRMGAVKTALEIQNLLAVREVRNSANRISNCFDSNLDKTIKSSTEQLRAINYLFDHYSIDYLPENLREVAMVRIANPDVSLSDMQKLLGGKISRAGIKYRLDKIIEIYLKLTGENK